MLAPWQLGFCPYFILASSPLLSTPCVHAWAFSHISLFVTPRTIAHQAPLSIKFSRQEYWSELPFPPPGDLSTPGTEPASPASAGGFSTTEPSGKPPCIPSSMKYWLWAGCVSSWGNSKEQSHVQHPRDYPAMSTLKALCVPGSLVASSCLSPKFSADAPLQHHPSAQTQRPASEEADLHHVSPGQSSRRKVRVVWKLLNRIPASILKTPSGQWDATTEIMNCGHRILLPPCISPSDMVPTHLCCVSLKLVSEAAASPALQPPASSKPPSSPYLCPDPRQLIPPIENLMSLLWAVTLLITPIALNKRKKEMQWTSPGPRQPWMSSP